MTSCKETKETQELTENEVFFDPPNRLFDLVERLSQELLKNTEEKLKVHDIFLRLIAIS